MCMDETSFSKQHRPLANTILKKICTIELHLHLKNRDENIQNETQNNPTRVPSKEDFCKITAIILTICNQIIDLQRVYRKQDQLNKTVQIVLSLTSSKFQNIKHPGTIIPCHNL